MHTGGTSVAKFEFSHNYIKIGGIWWQFVGILVAIEGIRGAFLFFFFISRKYFFCKNK